MYMYVHNSRALLDWASEKSAEIRAAEAVRGVPEGIEDQLQQVEVRVGIWFYTHPSTYS